MVAEKYEDITEVDEDFLDENNWFIKIDEEVKGISIPAIYSDGCIAFRKI